MHHVCIIMLENEIPFNASELWARAGMRERDIAQSHNFDKESLVVVCARARSRIPFNIGNFIAYITSVYTPMLFIERFA